MREFLVTTFVCSRCGSALSLTYDVPKTANRYVNGEPTGAAMVKQVIAIEPCKCLIYKIDDITKAIKTLKFFTDEKVTRTDNSGV